MKTHSLTLHAGPRFLKASSFEDALIIDVFDGSHIYDTSYTLTEKPSPEFFALLAEKLEVSANDLSEVLLFNFYGDSK